MKVATIFGTRPEIIRLSRIIAVLDKYCEHTLIHTGQNFDHNLSDIFFDELGIRPPDIHLGIVSRLFHEQASEILRKVGECLIETRPDRVLLLGDTNSGLAAVVSARLGIPVFHLEAGNRCYDERVPEEINRRIIDHSSTILMPYTYRSMENLLREGIERDRIYVIGNPIKEVIDHHSAAIAARRVHEALGVRPGGYFLATIHRSENVDIPDRLARMMSAIGTVARTYARPVLLSLHPRTADKLEQYGITLDGESIQVFEPLGLLDFVALEKHACAVITDSGTVQEECAIFGIPNVTVRDVTERAETIEVGSNMLAGCDGESLLTAVDLVLTAGQSWQAPPEYLVTNVSSTVAKIVLGYLGPVGRLNIRQRVL